MKWTDRFLGRQMQSLGIAIGTGKPSQIHQRHMKGVRRGHDLNRLPAGHAEGGAQRFVAAQDLAEALLQRLLAESP